MARTGIGDAELARRIGISRLTLVRWKLGVTSRPRHREDVARCADLLRLTPEETAELLLSAGFSPDDVPPPGEPPEPDPAEPATAAPPEPLVDEPTTDERRPRNRRTWAVAAAAILMVVIVGGLAAFMLLRGTPYPSAEQGESLIVMAPFVNYTGGQHGFNVHGRLRDQIEREIQAAGLLDVRTAEWPDEIAAEEAAVSAGLQSGAKIVIWGEYDSGRVVASFTMPLSRSEPHDQRVVDLATSPSELPATINVGLAQEVRYVALLTLGQLYLEQDAFHAAKLVLLRAMAEPPTDPDTLASIRFRLGRAYQGGESADLDEAIVLFTQVLDVRPRSVDTYNSRALAYLDRGGTGDVDHALQDLNRAAEIDPGNAATYLNRAVAYMESGSGENLDHAIANLTKAMSLRADYAPAYVNRAGAYLQRNGPGDLDRAFRDLDRALQIEPDLEPAYLTRGNAYLVRGGAGSLQLAKQDLEKAIELAPDSARAYYNRGLVHSALGDLDASVADLQRAHRLRPGEPSYNNSLCWQLGVSGKPAEALPYCDAAVAANVGQARDARGLVYATMGRHADAITEFEAFLDWVDASVKESCRRHYRTSRSSWLRTLRNGESPFDPATLSRLSIRPVGPGHDPC